MPTIRSSDLVVSNPPKFFKSTDAKDATLVVQNDPTKSLSVGRHRFALVVTDDSGNRSAQAFVEVVVLDNQAPTALIAPPDPLNIVFGSSFTLDGSPSTDQGGGLIVGYEWTMIS